MCVVGGLPAVVAGGASAHPLLSGSHPFELRHVHSIPILEDIALNHHGSAAVKAVLTRAEVPTHTKLCERKLQARTRNLWVRSRIAGARLGDRRAKRFVPETTSAAAVRRNLPTLALKQQQQREPAMGLRAAVWGAACHKKDTGGRVRVESGESSAGKARWQDIWQDACPPI